MQRLSNISLTQFRNYSSASFEVDAPVIAISGNNGIGKTNLLDAVYYLCFTKSYFQSREINNVQEGTHGFRIQGTFSNVLTTDNTAIIWKEGKKKLFENDNLVEKITQYIGKHTALMIAPDDIELVNGASNIRRKFFDGMLAQSDPAYLEHLVTYQKIIDQKNAYLKLGEYQTNHQLLDIYDDQLAEHGSYLLDKRLIASQFIPNCVVNYYEAIALQKEAIAVIYQPCIANVNEYRAMLQYNRRKDLESRRSSFGVHTEDWLLQLNGKPYKTHASQGQKKSLLIALKLAQLEWLKNLDKTPIVLLDDIFEKLDQHRIQRLFAVLKNLAIPQLWMTHTHTADMNAALTHHFNEIKEIKL